MNCGQKTFGNEIDNLIINPKNPTKKDELTFDESVTWC
jgi:hypothetical protein